MQTSAVGTKGPQGFTLLELLVVIAIMALATAGVGLALRDSAQTQLEREAWRLGALLESARAQSRLSAYPVRWHPTPTGFVFEGLPGPVTPQAWLDASVTVAPDTAPIVLGPEPIIPAQTIRLVVSTQPDYSVTLATDGVRPFTVHAPDPVPSP